MRHSTDDAPTDDGRDSDDTRTCAGECVSYPRYFDDRPDRHHGVRRCDDDGIRGQHRLEDPRCRSCGFHASELHIPDVRNCAVPDPPFLEMEVAPIRGVDASLDAIVRDRQQTHLKTQMFSDSSGHV